MDRSGKVIRDYTTQPGEPVEYSIIIESSHGHQD